MKLIDTSAWVEFLRRKGDPGAKQSIRAALPVICRDTHFDAIRKVVGEKLKVEQI